LVKTLNIVFLLIQEPKLVFFLLNKQIVWTKAMWHYVLRITLLLILMGLNNWPLFSGSHALLPGDFA
jgi:hypothetical protein